MRRQRKEITVYGTETCKDSIRSRAWLNGCGIAYRWVDVDRDRDGYAYVVEVNNGRRTIPTIVLDDGSILVEPSDEELAEKLGKRPTGQ